MLATRELNVDKLRRAAATGLRELIYTHGYGIT